MNYQFLKPFWITPTNSDGYRRGFLIWAADYARLCCKGHHTKDAYDKALETAVQIVCDNQTDEYKLRDLVTCLEGYFVEVSFILHGDNFRSVVRWPRGNRYPEVVPA